VKYWTEKEKVFTTIMAVLSNSKHEQFAQLVAKGVSGTKAYTSAGYSANGAKQSAARMLTNADLCARIRELQKTISEGTIDVEIRRRSARVQVLQNLLDRLVNVITARALEHSDHLAGATGLLVKDYRGKNAEQEIWKFDAALVAQIQDVLKQAAIEEGQWTEKRGLSGSVGIDVIRARLNAGRDRVAAAKKASLAKGEPWP